MNTDPRVTAYIEQAEPFAQPILNHIRQLVHQACPKVNETIKWMFPHFEYKGVVCHMAGFRQHCAFGFWKASLLSDPQQLLQTSEKVAMGNFGQIKSLADLPSEDILLAYIREAVQLNEDNVKLPPRAKAAKQEVVVPEYFLEALEQNEQAKATFENFSYSHRKEYVSWITEAKTDATRENRIATALEWLAEGKSRNWKYEKVKG